MNKLEFQTNYSADNSVISISVILVSTQETAAYLRRFSPTNPEFMLEPKHNWAYSAKVLKEIAAKLEKLNKPAYKAPPEGFFKCIACGVEVVIKPIPYEEQAACPCRTCDGQVFCNKFKGWSE